MTTNGWGPFPLGIWTYAATSAPSEEGYLMYFKSAKLSGSKKGLTETKNSILLSFNK